MIEDIGEPKVMEMVQADPKYIPLIVEDENGTVKFNSVEAPARYCGVSSQTVKYSYWTKSEKLVRKKNGAKEFKITWL